MQSPSTFQELELLLQRFYGRSISNEERQQIERRLQELQHTTFNWRFCIAHLSKFNNSKVWFFAANTVDRTISTAWNGLSPADRQQMRQELLQLYHGYPVDVPGLNREKIAQIVANMERRACVDEPEGYGLFVERVLQLFRTKFQLGLALCGAIGDSAPQPKDGPADFMQLLHRYLPPIMQELTQWSALFAMMAGGVASGTSLDALSVERKDHYCGRLMGVVQQYFGWMRLDQVEPLLISNMARIATIGAEWPEATLGALLAFYELLCRNECLRPEAGRQLAGSVFGIVAHVSQQRHCYDLYSDKVCDLMRQYIKRGWPHCEPMLAHSEELLQHLYQFTIRASPMLVLSDRINMWAYVIGESRYADDGETVWQQQQGTPRPRISPMLAHQLVQFLNTVLFCRSYSGLKTMDDDDDDDDESYDDSETDRQRYINQIIDIQVQLVKRMMPQQMEELLLAMLFGNGAGPCSYTDGHRVFQAMVEAIMGNEDSLKRYNEPQLADVLDDYVTACKLAIELCDALYGQHPQVDAVIHQATSVHIQLLMEVNQVVEQMLNLAVRLSGVTRHIYNALAQCIRTMKHLIQFGPPVPVQVAGQGTVMRKISPVVSSSMQQLLISPLPYYLRNLQLTAHENEWMEVVRAVIELLSLYAANAPQGPLTAKILLDQLCQYGVGNTAMSHLDRPTRSLLHRLVCSTLLQLDQEANGPPSINNNNNPANDGTAAQSALLDQYIESIGRTLFMFDANHWETAALELQLQIVHQLADELKDLTDILHYFQSESNSRMRTRLAHSIVRLVERAVNVFRGTIMPSETARDRYACMLIDVLLDFFCQSVGALQSRLDMGLLQQVLELLHGLFVAEVKAGLNRLGTAMKLVETFRLLVPDPRNKPLVPVILRVALQELLPFIASEERFTSYLETLRYEDVLGQVYELLHDLLHHRWQHFVQTNPMHTSEPDLRTTVEPEPFLAIMNAYGYTLTHSTGYPQVVRTVLTSLATLDERRNLYRLPLFVDQLKDNFIQSLLRLALSNTGPMHFDQIVTALYGMSRIDPIRIRVLICDMNLARDAETHRMLQLVDDPTSFQALIRRIIEQAKTVPPEPEVASGMKKGD